MGAGVMQGLSRSVFSLGRASSSLSACSVRAYSSPVYMGTGGERISRPQFQSDMVNTPTEERKTFSYFMFGASGLTFGLGGVEAVKNIALTMQPAADVLAMANIEVDLNSIAEGENLTLKWRGKPLFIRHRTDEEISAATRDDTATLRDPQPDSE